MLDHVNLQNILFLDIETVPQYEEYKMLPGHLKLLWDHKASFLTSNGTPPEEFYDRAGIYAEFGKIVCISTGILTQTKDNHPHFRIKSFSGENEKELLSGFID